VCIVSAISSHRIAAKLTINKLSVLYGPCTGGNELIILCSKVRKGTALVQGRGGGAGAWRGPDPHVYVWPPAAGTTTVVLSDAQVTDGSAARSANVDVVKGDTYVHRIYRTNKQFVMTIRIAPRRPQWQIDPVSRLGICVMPIRCLSFHHQYAMYVKRQATLSQCGGSVSRDHRGAQA
jgi:hypothetical protein